MSATRVAIAGSSGSIGTQTLDVVRAEPRPLRGRRRSASGRRSTPLIEQAEEFRPAVVAVTDPAQRAEVADALPFVTVVADLADLVEAADVVVNGVVGFAGLPVTIETLRGRQAPGAGQQGEPHRRRAGRAAAAVESRAPNWSRSTASTARCTSACGRRSTPTARSPGC